MRSMFESKGRRSIYEAASSGSGATSGAVGGALATDTIATAPAALYLFDGDLTDASGAGNDFTVAAGTERYAYHAGARYFFFDGATRLEVTAAAHRIAGDFTMFLQIANMYEQTTTHHIFGCGSQSAGSANNHQWYLYVSSSLWTWTHQNASKSPNTVAISRYRTGTSGGDACLAIVRDTTAKSIKYYLNGAFLNETDTYANNPDGGSSAVTLMGGASDGTALCEWMMIRNAAIYSAALAEADILTLTKTAQGVTA